MFPLSSRGAGSAISSAGTLAQSAAASGLSSTTIISIIVVCAVLGIIVAITVIAKRRKKGDRAGDLEKASRRVGARNRLEADADGEFMRGLRGEMIQPTATTASSTQKKEEDEEKKKKTENGLRLADTSDRSGMKPGYHEGTDKRLLSPVAWPHGMVGHATPGMPDSRQSHSRNSSWDSRSATGAESPHREGSPLLVYREEQDDRRRTTTTTENRIGAGGRSLMVPEPTVPPRSPRLVATGERF